jgi:hypothetical protein
VLLAGQGQYLQDTLSNSFDACSETGNIGLKHNQILKEAVRLKITKLRIFFIIVSALFLWGAIDLIANPLRRSEEQIRANLMQVFPIGTQMDEVIRITKNHRRWEIRGVPIERGIPRSWTHGRSSGFPRPNDIIVGEQSLIIDLGDYTYAFPFGNNVEAFVAFDENSELVEIAIRKTMR